MMEKHMKEMTWSFRPLIHLASLLILVDLIGWLNTLLLHSVINIVLSSLILLFRLQANADSTVLDDNMTGSTFDDTLNQTTDNSFHSAFDNSGPTGDIVIPVAPVAKKRGRPRIHPLPSPTDPNNPRKRRKFNDTIRAKPADNKLGKGLSERQYPGLNPDCWANQVVYQISFDPIISFSITYPRKDSNDGVRYHNQIFCRICEKNLILCDRAIPNIVKHLGRKDHFSKEASIRFNSGLTVFYPGETTPAPKKWFGSENYHSQGFAHFSQLTVDDILPEETLILELPTTRNLKKANKPSMTVQRNAVEQRCREGPIFSEHRVVYKKLLLHLQTGLKFQTSFQPITEHFLASMQDTNVPPEIEIEDKPIDFMKDVFFYGYFPFLRRVITSTLSKLKM